MNLNLKDLLTTLLASYVGYSLITKYRGLSAPFPESVRWGVILLLIIGVTMCSLSSANIAEIKDKSVLFVMSIHGIIALIFTVYGLISGNRIALYLLGGDLLVMWLFTTSKHLLGI